MPKRISRSKVSKSWLEFSSDAIVAFSSRYLRHRILPFPLRSLAADGELENANENSWHFETRQRWLTVYFFSVNFYFYKGASITFQSVFFIHIMLRHLAPPFLIYITCAASNWNIDNHISVHIKIWNMCEFDYPFETPSSLHHIEEWREK